MVEYIKGQYVQHKKIYISIISALIFLLMIALGNITGLMGNSAINYYCESSYQLNGNKCVKITKVNSILVGDITLDSTIDSVDYTTLSKYLNGYISLSEHQLVAADANEDGRIDSNDFNAILDFTKNDSIDTVKTPYMMDKKIGDARKCPSNFDNITYTLNKDDNQYCYKKTVIDAIKSSGKFTVKYNSNEGYSENNMSMKDDIFTINNKTKYLKNNIYIKNGFLFQGWNAHNISNDKWLCYSNASHSNEEWVDINDTYNKLTSNGQCKYGLYLYLDESSIDNIATNGQVVEMIAVWAN